MLCGYLKHTCRSITIEELINILQLCKNKKAIVKMSNMTNFYIHFDQDGQYIDITKSANANQYSTECNTCTRHDKTNNVCKCTGEDCLNASLMVDTAKLNQLRSDKKNEEVEEDRSHIVNKEMEMYEAKKKVQEEFNKNSAIKIELATPEQDLIYVKPNNDTIKVEAKPVPLEIKQEKEVSLNEGLESIINNAISKALEKMINSLKG